MSRDGAMLHIGKLVRMWVFWALLRLADLLTRVAGRLLPRCPSR